MTGVPRLRWRDIPVSESIKSLELALFNGEESPIAPYTPMSKCNRNYARQHQSGLQIGVHSGDMAACQSLRRLWAAFIVNGTRR